MTKMTKMFLRHVTPPCLKTCRATEYVQFKFKLKLKLYLPYNTTMHNTTYSEMFLSLILKGIILTHLQGSKIIHDSHQIQILGLTFSEQLNHLLLPHANSKR